MKTLLLLLLSAALASAQTPPVKADLPKYSREGVIKIARQLQAITKEATARAEALDAKLQAARGWLDEADAKAIELQRELDTVKLELFKAEQKLEKWRKFGRAMLGVISFAVFAGLWQLLAFLPLPYRLASSVLGGGAGAFLVWRFFTHGL